MTSVDRHLVIVTGASRGLGRAMAEQLLQPGNLVLGISRKSFIGKVHGSAAMADREWPTVALTSYGRERGASVFRVHDLRANVHALRMTEAILQPQIAE